MKAKEFLRQYIDADRAINAKLEEISQLRAKATKVTSVLSENKVQQTMEPDRISSIVAKIADMEKEVDEDIDRLLEIKQKVGKAINSVNDSRLRTLLYLRYICDWTFEEIAVELDKSWRWTVVLHGEALKKVEKFLRTSC